MLDKSAKQRRSLTYWEWQALSSNANLSDGHARGWISQAHRVLAARMSDIYESSVYSSQETAQVHFLKSFYTATDQAYGRFLRMPFFYYSASTAIDAVFASLAQAKIHSLGLITPTFDNLAALARSRDLLLKPIEEQILWDATYLSVCFASSFDALMIVVPNNPTGQEMSEAHFKLLATECSKRQVLLIIDASFRFFAKSNWDLYRVLLEFEELRWYVIEDTGKAVGLAELKVGFVNCDESSETYLSTVTENVLLNVSPFVLGCLTMMLGDDVEGISHLDEIREAIATNRAFLQKIISTLPELKVVNPRSTSSVEWIQAEVQPTAEELCHELMQAGVYVLPGGAFFWENQMRGERHLRLALARDPRYFAECLAQASPVLQRCVGLGR